MSPSSVFTPTMISIITGFALTLLAIATKVVAKINKAQKISTPLTESVVIADVAPADVPLEHKTVSNIV